MLWQGVRLPIVVGQYLTGRISMGGGQMANTQLADLVTDVKQALDNSPVFSLTQLQIQIEDDQLVLSGKVNTFYQKQLAQETVRSVMRNAHGSPRMLNRVDVTQP